MADVKWIKIVTNIFDNRKIKQIEKLPDGDTIIVIWLKLLCLAGTINDSGYVYLTEEVPYTDEMLSTQFDRPLATIQLAIKTFEMFGMIEVIDDILHVSNWENYQNIEGMEKIREQNRLRKQKQREKEKLLLDSHVMSRDSHATDKNRIDKNKKENREEVSMQASNIISSYEQNIGLLTPISAQKLLSYTDDLSEEVIIKAIEIASLRNKRNTNYITGILNSWVNKGIRTVGDIENEQSQKETPQDDEKARVEARLKRLKEKFGGGEDEC